MTKGIINGCVDPRLHSVLPEAAQLMGVENAYIFRVPGPDGMWTLSDSEQHPELGVEKNGNLAAIRRLSGLAEISAYSMVGHTDCAGHPATDDEHREHTKVAARAMKLELGTEKPVYAILAVRGASDEEWDLEVLEVF